MRVLIADDSAVERLAARRIVESLGHECLVAEDGEQAWEVFSEHGADVILSDWVMPRLEGAELCRRVRNADGAGYTYLILLTVLDDRGHTVQGMRAGADEYLAKPLHVEALEKALLAAERVTALHRRIAHQRAGRERALARRDLVLGVARDLAAHADPDLLLEELLSRSVDLLGARTGAIGCWDAAQEALVAIQTVQRPGAGGEDLEVSQVVLQRAARQPRAHVLPEGVGAPLLHEGRLLGAMALVGPAGGIPFGQEDAETVQQLAAIGAAALVGLDRARMEGARFAARAIGSALPEHAEAALTGRGLRMRADFPAQPTPLVGREGELDAARDLLLQPDVRLVTLTGPAGVGKTRLALAVGASLLDEFADGARLVDLTSVDDPELVLATIARRLGLSEVNEWSLLDSVRRALGPQRLLLVLDNFERVLPAAAVLGKLLSSCAGLKVLVTSRSPLRVGWEHVLPVAPLGLPDPAADDLASLSRAPAVALYVQRLTAVQPGFELTNANARAVAEACIRLDGLPLAIELAAARSQVLTPRALSSRPEPPLSLLKAGFRDLPERHQTLRGAIAWSYALLTERQQRLCRLAGVFSRGFTASAAAAVCGSLGAEESEILDDLMALVDRSLVCQDPQDDAEPRFRMLETIREYAREQLATCGELGEARRRHANYFTRLAELAASELFGPAQGVWLDRLECEHDNMRAALQWAVDAGDTQLQLRLVAALASFWVLRGYLKGGGDNLEAALSRSIGAPAALRAGLLSGAAALAIAAGEWAPAGVRLDLALELWRALDDRRRCAVTLAELAFVRFRQGDTASARALIRESLPLARAVGDPATLAGVLHRSAEISFAQGKAAGARGLYAESFTLARDAGDRWRAAAALEGVAAIAAANGQSRHALVLSGTAAGLREMLRTPLSPVEQILLDHRILPARQELGEQAAAEALAEGRALLLEEVMIDDVETAPASQMLDVVESLVSPATILTRRERQVAELVAKGRTNRQIGEELSITEKTAEAHLSSILHKLELTSRTQLAAWVVEHKLLPPGRKAV